VPSEQNGFKIRKTAPNDIAGLNLKAYQTIRDAFDIHCYPGERSSGKGWEEISDAALPDPVKGLISRSLKMSGSGVDFYERVVREDPTTVVSICKRSLRGYTVFVKYFCDGDTIGHIVATKGERPIFLVDTGDMKKDMEADMVGWSSREEVMQMVKDLMPIAIRNDERFERELRKLDESLDEIDLAED